MTNSERNAPADVSSVDVRLREEVVAGIRSATARDGLSPAEVAEQVHDAIRDRSFYVLTHRDAALAAVSQRLEWMRTDGQPLPRVLR